MSRHEVWRRVGRLAFRGAGVILRTHDLAEAERCSSAALLSEGRIVAAGTPEQIAPEHRRGRVPALWNRRTPTGTTISEPCPGVIATIPQGPGLRVVADAAAGESLAARRERLRRAALPTWQCSLEDAVLASSKLC